MDGDMQNQDQQTTQAADLAAQDQQTTRASLDESQAQDQTTTAPALTEASTTETPITTTEAPTTGAPITEAPTTQAAIEEVTTQAPTEQATEEEPTPQPDAANTETAVASLLERVRAQIAGDSSNRDQTRELMVVERILIDATQALMQLKLLPEPLRSEVATLVRDLAGVA